MQTILLRVVPTSQSGFAAGFLAGTMAAVVAEDIVAKIVVAKKNVDAIAASDFFTLFPPFYVNVL
jgi:uridylate kinase